MKWLSLLSSVQYVSAEAVSFLTLIYQHPSNNLLMACKWSVMWKTRECKASLVVASAEMNLEDNGRHKWKKSKINGHERLGKTSKRWVRGGKGCRAPEHLAGEEEWRCEDCPTPQHMEPLEAWKKKMSRYYKDNNVVPHWRWAGDIFRQCGAFMANNIVFIILMPFTRHRFIESAGCVCYFVQCCLSSGAGNYEEKHFPQ